MNLKLKAALITAGIILTIITFITCLFLFPEKVLAVLSFGAFSLGVYMIYNSTYEELRNHED